MGLRLYDSCFFVDLHREQRQRRDGAATRHLLEHPDGAVAMSAVTLGELARGFATRDSWKDFSRGFLVYPLDEDALWIAAEVFRELRRRGIPISDNDLWIAATALQRDLELVTHNARHFERVPGLRLRPYE